MATPAVLDGVKVSAYGSLMPLSQVASISAEGPKSLFINVYDKSQIKTVEKAIIDSGLGLSANSNDTGVRVSFPDLTVERKQMLMKLAKEKLEKARVSVRQERDKQWQELQDAEKNGEIGEDEKFSMKEKMEEAVKKTNQSLEEALNRKEEEIQQ